MPAGTAADASSYVINVPPEKLPPYADDIQTTIGSQNTKNAVLHNIHFTHSDIIQNSILVFN
jgi:hypothetical protein